jgi:autotransporter-associated beta strand protein
LTFGGGIISSDTTASRTIANVYSLGGAVSIGDTAKYGILTFTGAGTMSSATTVTALSPVVFGGVLGGAFALTKAGGSELTLSGVNTYTGATTVSDGTLAISGGNAIPDAGAVTVTSPGILKLGGNETVGMVDGTGSVNLQGNALTLSGGGTGVLSGVVSGTGGSLVQSGAGQLTLSGSNTFTGGATVSSGTVWVGNNAAFGTGLLTVSGGIVASTGASGAGDRTLGNGLSLSGTVTLGDGTNTGALKFTGNGAVAAPLTLTTASAVEFTGVLSGTGSLTKLGAGASGLCG